MAQLTRDDILKLAQLARLDLSDDEVEQFKTEIQAILGYVEQLQAVKLDDLEPTNQVTGLSNVMREDMVVDYGYETDSLLQNVPAKEGRYIKVKRVIE